MAWLHLAVLFSRRIFLFLFFDPSSIGTEYSLESVLTD